MSVRQKFTIISIIVFLSIIILALFWTSALWSLMVILPLIGLGIHDIIQRKHTILRLYPVVGHIRFLLESIRPEIQQYFVENDTSGTPFSREFRALVYQRAKGQRDTRPFGTQFDIYRSGYEWLDHSLSPTPVNDKNPRVRFGNSDSNQPYDASPLNISAMSFGALSQNAIMALNKGARIGNFAHNTGEGGISPYHLKHGGDLIWQVGTGYFGCRNSEGDFDETLFTENVGHDAVKMIEIKLSQGAKPGHGGILPTVKLTQEIADIRHVPMGHDVVSPPAHSAFSSPIGLLEFIAKLRVCSGGKPVGFKLCIGKKSEFLAICKAMLVTGITPDFITVDGAEGGTGAAPIEMTNSVGTPLRDGLNFVNNALIGIGLRDKIRIIAAGRVASAFHMLRLMALGADTINSARAMMFALGCVQSRKCNEGTCPTGIATQDQDRYKALDIEDKSERVANYHASMIENVMDLVIATGLNSLNEIRPEHINHRTKGAETKNYAELYPSIIDKCLLTDITIPEIWQKHWQQADSNHW